MRLGQTQRSCIQLLVLQASSFCNIDCRYCYVRGRDRAERMPDAVLDAVARNLIPSRLTGAELSVCWHAGEPLAVPRAWYEDACTRLAAAARPGQRLVQHVQTNAMLIDDGWLETFQRHGFRVGVSIDGPQPIHDANRVTRRGQGTHRETMQGISRLRAADYPFDVIAVLTAPALDEPDALFDFFASLGARSVGFNIDEIEGPNTQSSLAVADAEGRFRRFLERFLRRHADAGEPFALRPLTQLRSAIAGRVRGAAMIANHQVEPLGILVVGADGALSTFSPELIGTPEPAFGDFVFGNVLAGGPEQILRNPHFRRLRRAVDAGRRRCARRCGYFDLCGGGAPGNKYFESGRVDIDETLYCRLSVQQMLEATLRHLEAAGEDART
ncbi:hypothetical protein CKO31_03820 [Thiohalocapsa halophila]|uniref:Radical SAM core domain-containing protein n=1 Tax=Thiohalocapsa halophila TaxID=69359 RepID=A0ABS1CDB6_9GAMM|nr:cyclophane-forming radical SAM/SPASM peptide maturase GrrM/OscB [Thiohalocapsa halophila]MBK1629882.1 hypothetical protein [Thiohalocapsa halophila]